MLANKLRGEELNTYSGILNEAKNWPVIKYLVNTVKDNLVDDVTITDSITPAQLRDANRGYWCAQKIASVAVKTKSEWKKDPARWKALDKLMGHTDATPNQNWLIEKSKIEKLSFWDEVSGVVGNSDGKVWGLNFFYMTSLMQTKTCLTLNDTQILALKISTGFEGRTELDYGALAGDFDGQGMSFGLIQWNFGQNTLGPILQAMQESNAEVFDSCFPPEVNFTMLNNALASLDISAQLAWSRQVQRDSPVQWKKSFENLSKVQAFNDIQLSFAVKYHSNVVGVINFIRELKPSLTEFIEVITYVAFYDMCVQQGSISRIKDEIRARVLIENPKTQEELSAIVIQERANSANERWRSDCLSRRMGILTRSTYEATVSGRTSSRTNNNYQLLNDISGVVICDF